MLPDVNKDFQILKNHKKILVGILVKYGLTVNREDFVKIFENVAILFHF